MPSQLSNGQGVCHPRLFWSLITGWVDNVTLRCGVVGSFSPWPVSPFPHRRVARAVFSFLHFKESFIKSL